MQRRLALALSLAFTTIVTFGVIAVGAQTGIFGGGHTEKAQQTAVEQSPEPPTPAPTVAPAPPTPVIITEYVYVDEPAPVRAAAAPPQEPVTGLSAPTQAAEATPTSEPPTPVTDAQPAPPPHEEEHEDEPEHSSEEPHHEEEHEDDD